MSYTIDVNRGILAPRQSILDVALFVSYFPHLVAGPIIRAAYFLPQLDKEQTWDPIRAKSGFLLMLWGMAKKLLIADALAPIVNQAYASPDLYSGQAWCWPLTALRSRFTVTFPDTAIWRSVPPVCSVSIYLPTSISPILPPVSPRFGSDGIYRFPPGFATTCTYRSADRTAGSPGPASTSWPPWCLAVYGMERAGTLWRGARYTAPF